MLKTKSFVTRMVVIVAFTQAVLLSALVTVLVSLTAAEGIPEPVPGGCPYPNNANPQIRYCGNPHENADFGAPPQPACSSPVIQKHNLFVCRLER